MQKKSRWRKLPSPAMVIAIIAVILATTGSAFAASSLITGSKIKDGTIALKDLTPAVQKLIKAHGKSGTNGTNGANGQNGGAGAKGDAGANGVNGAKGADGAAGAKGDKGDAGAKGDKGDKGDTGDTGAIGPVGPQGPQGSSAAMPGDFSLTNASVKVTSDGVQFGPYADAGAAGGSIEYIGLSGKTLADITALTFRSKYTTSDADDHATPYLRVFIDNDGDGMTDHSVIYSPNTQATPDASEGVFHSYDVFAGTVRYDDDAGDGSGEYGLDGTDWATLAADHGTDVIQAIYVTQGFSGGHDAEAFVTDMGVNDKSWHFGQG